MPKFSLVWSRGLPELWTEQTVGRGCVELWTDLQNWGSNSVQTELNLQFFIDVLSGKKECGRYLQVYAIWETCRRHLSSEECRFGCGSNFLDCAIIYKVNCWSSELVSVMLVPTDHTICWCMQTHLFVPTCTLFVHVHMHCRSSIPNTHCHDYFLSLALNLSAMPLTSTKALTLSAEPTQTLSTTISARLSITSSTTDHVQVTRPRRLQTILTLPLCLSLYVPLQPMHISFGSILAHTSDHHSTGLFTIDRPFSIEYLRFILPISFSLTASYLVPLFDISPSLCRYLAHCLPIYNAPYALSFPFSLSAFRLILLVVPLYIILALTLHLFILRLIGSQLSYYLSLVVRTFLSFLLVDS